MAGDEQTTLVRHLPPSERAKALQVVDGVVTATTVEQGDVEKKVSQLYTRLAEMTSSLDDEVLLARSMHIRFALRGLTRPMICLRVFVSASRDGCTAFDSLMVAW